MEKENNKDNLDKNTNKTTIKDKKTADKKEVQPKEEHVIYVDTNETVEQFDDDLNNRINKLYGLSSNHVKETKQYDPKELEEVRKKLILLLIGIIVFGVIVIVIMINPFDFSSRKNYNNTQNEQKEPVVEEPKIPIGELSIDSSLALTLNSKVMFNVNDFMEIDLFDLYKSEVLEINNLSNDIKLYLFKKSADFFELIGTDETDEYIKTCDSNGLEISKDAFDLAFKKTFGSNVTIEYAPINYSYSFGESMEKKLTLVYENEKFILRCNEFTKGSEVVKFVQQKLNKAVKTETGAEIYQNVVFINRSGVYKDPNFTELITNDTQAVLNDYINQGSIYKYTFNQEGDNYYLSKIEKVIGTAS